ncbi:hypothetical protein [Kurthia sibirica]|uniref:Uncharacterized protein n=1 Tax=Kurthia sibirica TaxID=202750 RepID=A0A2U3AJP0_9BACL|nr:hypothetical protein [Kurthia sibirica]PWI24691.1 hypothetical protein DEX24_12040 [Kurthia sibirica]GEK34533.1 hypothetical protein KSI01_20660 [Kurthia sibirica]
MSKYTSLIIAITITLFLLNKITSILFLIIFIPSSIFMLIFGILELKKAFKSDDEIKKHALEIKNRNKNNTQKHN